MRLYVVFLQLIFLLIFAIPPAVGQPLPPGLAPPPEVYTPERMTAVSTDFGERINLDNGEMSFIVTDIDLPGNSDLPVTFGRRFETRLQYTNDRFDYPQITGVTSGGSDPTAIHYLEFMWTAPTLYIPGQPGKRFYKVAPGHSNNGGHQLITADNWGATYQRVGSEWHFTVKSPTGIVYEFKKTIRNPGPKGEGLVGATTVRDLHGNTVSYTYTTIPPTWVSGPTIRKIEASDGREIIINRDSNERIINARANGRTWRYEYFAPQVKDIKKVILPDGRYWEYDLPYWHDLTTYFLNPWEYYNLNKNKVYNYWIKHPSGMRADYKLKVIRNYLHYVDACSAERNSYNHAVTEKKLSIPRAVDSTWRYTYGGGSATSQTKWRDITNPDGTRERHTLFQTYDWRAGVPQKIELYSSSGSLARRTEFTHVKSAQKARIKIQTTGQPLICNDDADYEVLQTNVKITQDGATYNTKYIYQNDNPASSNFDFWMPTKIERTSSVNSGNRITETTYSHD